MMNNIEYINVNNAKELNFKDISTEDLKMALVKSLEMSAKHLMFLAGIWIELEERGVDLTDLKSGISRYLTLIGSGKLDPNIVMLFAGQQTLLKELALLPINTQKKLLENQNITYVSKNKEGEFKVIESQLQVIHSSYYYQIFDNGHIRSESEQKTMLKTHKKRKRAIVVRKKKITVNVEQGYIQVGNMRIILADIVKALHKNKAL